MQINGAKGSFSIMHFDFTIRLVFPFIPFFGVRGEDMGNGLKCNTLDSSNASGILLEMQADVG